MKSERKTGSNGHFARIFSFRKTKIPWSKLLACITDVTVGDEVIGLDTNLFPKNVTFHVYLNSEIYEVAKQAGANIKLSALRILLIGNSHTADYSEFRDNILCDLKDSGLETEIVITRAIIGSIGLYSRRNSNANAQYRSHLEAIQNGKGAYEYLANNRYDLVIVQDYMESIIDTPVDFSQGLSAFIGTIKGISRENGNGIPQIAWFADWVDIRSTGGDSALFDGQGNKYYLPIRTRDEVYAHAVDNIMYIESQISEGVENMPDFVIQGVTIKQNAMSSYLGTTKLFENQKYCILERDTTHATYELGRYLMGAGVFSVILEHYREEFSMLDHTMTVGDALTLQNGPVAFGSGSQYQGALNEDLMLVIKEAICNADHFTQSVYVHDPVDMFIEQINAKEWDLSAADDRESCLNAIRAQTEAIAKDTVDSVTVEMHEFVSRSNFTVTLHIGSGYTVKQISLVVSTQE